MSYLADTADDNIIAMVASGQTLPLLIEGMASKDFSVFVPSLRAIGNILTTYDPELIDRCISNKVLNGLTNLLYATNASIIKECCWALSNITAGSSDHIEMFLESPAFQRVIELTKSYSIDHRKEAMWVVVNAITSSDVVVR